MDQSSSFWRDAKKEIFRLQLLNFYADDTCIPEFNQFLDNKFIDYEGVIGVKEWDKGLQDKKLQGVNIVNLHVTDLPLDNGLRFGVGFLRVHEKYGMRSWFVKREEVNDIIGGFRDFWMFDSKVVVPVIYNNNLWVKENEPLTDHNEVAKYIALKEALLKVSTPMESFIRNNNVDLKPVSKKDRIRC